MEPHEGAGDMHNAIEQDMLRLSAEVERHRENPEHREASSEELLKRSIEHMTGESGAAASPSANPLPSYAGDASDEEKIRIEKLLDLAFHKGIEEAVREARRADSYALDAFHDALVARLYPEMKQRGLIR